MSDKPVAYLRMNTYRCPEELVASPADLHEFDKLRDDRRFIHDGVPVYLHPQPKERVEYVWQDDPPKENGQFYYYGLLPRTEKRIVAIVQIYTDPFLGRAGVLIIPPNNEEGQSLPDTYFARIEDWKGQWRALNTDCFA